MMLQLTKLIRENYYSVLTLAGFPSLYIPRQKAKNKDFSIWKFFSTFTSTKVQKS